MEKITEQQILNKWPLGAKPLVSICTLAYNHEAYVREALDSFLAQETDFPFEIIIHDDASTDSTAEIIAGYQRLYPQIIKPIYQKQNQYSTGKRIGISFVFQKAEGEYIAFCEADDYWVDPHKLQKQAEFLRDNPDFSTCFGRAAVLRKNELLPDEHKQNYRAILGDRTEFGLEDVLQENFIATCAVMFRKKNFAGFPAWSEKLPFGDWVLHLLNAQQGKIKYFDDLMAVYRVHPGGTWTSKSLKEKYQGIFLFYHLVSQHLNHKYDDIILRAIEKIGLTYIEYSDQLQEAKEWLAGQLEQTQGQLAQTQGQLEQTWEQLGQTQGQLAQTQGQLGQTQGQLAKTQSQLNEILNSTIYKALGVLQRILNKVAPVGTLRRKALKKLFYFTYDQLKSGYCQWRRLGETRELIKKRFFTKKIHNTVRPAAAWPAEFPLVSVVIPCFNYGKYIEEAVDSVLGQTFKDLEIIIVDGGSTDGVTREILQKLCKPQTSIYYREGRHLVGDNRNFGIGLAKGKYICCLDADDMLEATYLEKALFFLETYRYDVVYPSVQCFEGDSIVWHASPTTFERMISAENAVSTVAVFSKEAWHQSGGYKDWPIGEGHVPEDWEFWARLMGLGYRFKNIHEPLMLYRVHQVGLTGQCKTSLAEQLKTIYDENCHLLTPHFSKIRKEHNSTFFKVNSPALNMKAAKNKRRIMLALPFMIIGGADTILLRIFSSLRTEFDITVVTTLEAPAEFGDNTTEYKKITPEIYHLKRFLSDDTEMRDFIHYLIESREIDLLFIVGNEFVYDMLPEIKRKYPGLKVIDQLFNEVGHIHNNRKHAALIDLSIVANNMISKILIEKYRESADKVNVIIHGIDVRKNDSRSASNGSLPGIVDGKLTVSYFGRFSSEKAPDLFVEIINSLKDYDIQAVMTGNGPKYNRTIDRITAYGLQDKIYAPGFVDDIRPYLERTDILLVPSRIEGLPIIILEALSLGVPVIASDLGGISTVILDGFDGYVCQAGNVDQFVDRIKELAENRGLLSAMKQNAIRFAKDNISEDKMNIAYYEAINKILQVERKG